MQCFVVATSIFYNCGKEVQGDSFSEAWLPLLGDHEKIQNVIV